MFRFGSSAGEPASVIGAISQITELLGSYRRIYQAKRRRPSCRSNSPFAKIFAGPWYGRLL